MFGNNCQFDKEEIIEPESKKVTKKRKTTAMLLNEQNKRLSKLEKQLKDFCEKWEWESLEDADETLTGSEQTIWEMIKENQRLKEDVNNLEQVCSICQKEQENDFLKAELEAEYKEHQEAMNEADNTIKVLDKALQLACANHTAVCGESMDCSKGVDCVGCLVEHYKAQAREELGNE